MAQINVRKLNFEFPEDVPVMSVPDDFSASMQALGGSLTLPHLEPYLIRTMRMAIRDVKDPVLAEDMKAFSAQEGFHFRNHSRINDIICSKLSPETAVQVRKIEAEMSADYERFTRDMPVKWNLAYAESFEAMSLISAITQFEQGFGKFEGSWAELWEWHLAEEIEHRTVCFDAYDKMFGSYWYRVRWGFWGQRHFLSYIDRFSRCVSRDFESRHGPYKPPPLTIKTLGRLLNTYMPWYNPRNYRISRQVENAWKKYDRVVAC